MKEKKNILPDADGLARQIDVIRCVITAELGVSFFGRQNGFLNWKNKKIIFWLHQDRTVELNLTTSVPDIRGGFEKQNKNETQIFFV